MKPKNLKLSGWGPYKGQVEVDFTKLEDRGLFLITGPTGAGKTTIFDAIAYALYGNMSGGMREKNSVRSDFADGDTATFVELVMQHGGKEYRVVRNPEYMRPKKKKGGKSAYTKEKENAVLYLPEGKTVEGSSEVNRKMQEILVLDYRQFKQISMIAQGEFAKLLVATPAEKTRIFREIFSTSIYDSFAGVLKGRSGELYKRIMECRNKMDEDIHMLQMGEVGRKERIAELTGKGVPPCPGGDSNAGGNSNIVAVIEALEEEEERYKAMLAKAEKEYSASEKELSALAERISRAERNNENLKKLEEMRGQKKALLEGKGKMDEAEAELKMARKASSLREEYVNCKNAGDLLQAMERKVEQHRKELEAYGRKQEELKEYYEKRDAIKASYELLASYEEKKKQLEESGRWMKKKKAELERLQRQYMDQEEEAGRKKRAFETADLAYKRAVVGIVARQIKEGMPCPVCGSLSHPHVAKTAEEVPDEEGLQRLQKSYEKERERLMELHGKAAACKGEAESRRTQEAEWEEQIKGLEAERSRLPEEIKRITETMSGREYEEILNRYHTYRVQIGEKEKQIAKDEEEQSGQKEKLQRLEGIFISGFETAGFVSREEYERALRPSGEMEKAEKEIKEYYARLQAIDGRIASLEEETKGKEKEDTAGLKAAYEEKRACRQQLLEVLNVQNHNLQETVKIKKSLKEKAKRLEGLEKEYGIVKDLDNMASGNNARRLVFEQYVLAGYFEEILRAANLRLEKMTGGRYELSRIEEVGDGRVKDNLEMQVLDYYTGKMRPVKTLSGGECFKASLALALGMSDVIQGYSGGIRADTLFIDEGFGALDGESLEQACRTLMSLTEKDRLIGIISHVPELSEKIEKQIVIKKTNVGSEIVVRD